MSDTRLLRQILYSELKTGKRPRGYPLRCYKDQLKQTMKKSNIDSKMWEEQAQNRNLWRQTTSIASELFEQNRSRSEADKRQQRKIRQAQP